MASWRSRVIRILIRLGLIGGGLIVILVIVLLVITVKIIRILEDYDVERYALPDTHTYQLKLSSLIPHAASSLAPEKTIPLSFEVVKSDPSGGRGQTIPLTPLAGTHIMEVRRIPASFSAREKSSSPHTAAVYFISQSPVDNNAISTVWSWQGEAFEDITFGRQGDVWASAPRSIMRWDGTRIEEIPLPAFPSRGYAPRLVEDTSGVWAIWQDTLLYYDGAYWHGRRSFAPVDIIIPAPPGGFLSARAWDSTLFWHTADSMMILTFSGLRLLPLGWSQDTLLCLFQNREIQGLLTWSGTQLHLRRSAIPLWNSRESVAVGEGLGKVIFASDRGTYLYEGHKLSQIGEKLPARLQNLVISHRGTIYGTLNNRNVFLSPEGKWRLEDKLELLRNIMHIGLDGKIWVARIFPSGEKILGVLSDNAADKVALPFSQGVVDFLTVGDTLWVLSSDGKIWLYDGQRWQSILSPFRLATPVLKWDVIGNALWITGAHKLICLKDQRWLSFPIDSVEEVVQGGEGTLWLLRGKKLYAGIQPLPFSDVRFIAAAPFNRLWLVRDSGIYVLHKDTLWQVDKGTYQALTVDTQGRLWTLTTDQTVEPLSCWDISRLLDGYTECERLTIGRKQGLGTTYSFIGGRDTLWWRDDKNRVWGMRLIPPYRRKLYRFLVVSGSRQLGYVSFLVPFPAQKVQKGRWQQNEGLFLQGSDGLYFYPKEPSTPAPAPRLRLRWRHIPPLPFLRDMPFVELPEYELGSTAEVHTQKTDEAPDDVVRLNGQVRWPRFTTVPFEISYFSYDLTFEVIPQGRLAKIPALEYRYRLRGLTDRWSRPSPEPKAFFHHLSEGTYTLEAQVRPVGGQWSAPVEWHFKVNPPPWRTPIAYALYAALGIGGVFLYIRHRLRALRKRAEHLQKEVEKATATIRSQNEALLTANEELKAQRDLIEEQRQSLIDSLIYARRIQQALLPPAEGLTAFFPESFVLFLPRDIVSGDIYWYYAPSLPQGGQELYLLVADCTGHGVPGAFMSLLTLSLLQKVMSDNTDKSPGRLLDAVSEQIIRMLNPESGQEEMKDGFEGVFCRFLWQPETLTLEYAAARRSFWLVRDGQAQDFPKDPIPVGLSEIPALRGTNFKTHRLLLQRGDWLYFSSDGYTDQLGGPEGRRFGIKRFRELLISLNSLSPGARQEKLSETLHAWRMQQNLPQVDDVLVVGLRVP